MLRLMECLLNMEVIVCYMLWGVCFRKIFRVLFSMVIRLLMNCFCMFYYLLCFVMLVEDR